MLGLALISPPVSAQDADPWWGADKAAHLGVSAGLSLVGYGLATPLTDDRSLRALGGFAGALSIGIGKELYDAVGPGRASMKDLMWDVVGAAVGTFVVWALDEAYADSAGPPTQDSAQPLQGASRALLNRRLLLSAFCESFELPHGLKVSDSRKSFRDLGLCLGIGAQALN